MKIEDLLLPEHIVHLREGSGLSDEVILERGYRSVSKRTELREFGFSAEQARRVPGILIPHYGPDGSNGHYQFRPDTPRVKYDKRKGKETIVKYENPAGVGVRIDCPPRCKEYIGDPKVELWITEGVKKADAGASHGLCIIALNGVWGFKGKNPLGGITVLADWDYIALKARTVNIVFDSDVMVNPNVKNALERLREHLQRKGALVNLIYLPGGRDKKVGLDDYLLENSVEDLVSLIDGPKPLLKAAPPMIELLDFAPSTISKPLMLLDGKAYAAVWPHVKKTKTETVGKDGEIVRLNPPIEEFGQQLMIITSDRLIYGDDKRRIEDVGAIVKLAEIPPANKLWSSPGIKRYLKNGSPTPIDVFNRIKAVINCFIDFDKSLTDQDGMCSLIACYIMSTWFMDAFNVAGYIWPNGERGSGKSQLLLLMAELGYLGQFILAGGTFAALRDLADYGALLCFDDAENLSDPRSTDPDKRTLLLAGNRRGSTVPIKVQQPDGTWKLRHVNTYCPRAFSAIRLPDPVLASRTITVPLVRSGDKNKANKDPLEYDLWPCDRKGLIDDLWALAVYNLPDLSMYERRVNQESELTGRNLEPWRSILAIALWLDDNGATGLSRKLNQVSLEYQSERSEFEGNDMTRLIVTAISAIFANSAINSEMVLSNQQITEKAKSIAEHDDNGIDPGKIDSKRVGWVLRRLRLERAGRVDGKKGRQWKVHRSDVDRWLGAYSINLEDVEGSYNQNGENGENGGMAADDPEKDFYEVDRGVL